MDRETLLKCKCNPIAQTDPALDASNTMQLHQSVRDWRIENKTISRRFNIKKYSEVLDFVMAVAAIATQENHHPNICFGYGFAEVQFTTHSVNGLSLNDFICAVKVDALFA